MSVDEPGVEGILPRGQLMVTGQSAGQQEGVKTRGGPGDPLQARG